MHKKLNSRLSNTTISILSNMLYVQFTIIRLHAPLFYTSLALKQFHNFPAIQESFQWFYSISGVFIYTGSFISLFSYLKWGMTTSFYCQFTSSYFYFVCQWPDSISIQLYIYGYCFHTLFFWCFVFLVSFPPNLCLSNLYDFFTYLHNTFTVPAFPEVDWFTSFLQCCFAICPPFLSLLTLSNKFFCWILYHFFEYFLSHPRKLGSWISLSCGMLDQDC